MKNILFLLSTVLFFNILVGQDRFFARTYTTNILPKGNIDLEFWHTSRFGHEGEFFHAQDQRLEIEFGLGHNIQTAFYFNRFAKTYGPNGDQFSSETGFSNEWKWKMSDPSINKIGSALYCEWGIKSNELELETKLILDKYINQNLLAFNLVSEMGNVFTRANGKTKLEFEEAPVELDLAYMRNLNARLGLGFELRNYNGISKDHGWENSVFFGGPTLNYRTGRWFVIVNYLPQWVNVHKTAQAPSSKVLNDLERNEVRILIGISF